MKKFLITFIIGVVFMAVGTTALFFEVSEFEPVSVYDVANDGDRNYKIETLTLKDDQTIMINMEGENAYYSYEREYDDSLKDTVKIIFHRNTTYQINNNNVVIEDIGYDDYESGWDRFRSILDGLKERKIYMNADDHITIVTSRANRARVQTSMENPNQYETD